MIILFKKYVVDKKSAARITRAVIRKYGVTDVNFDLEDRDRIPRIATNGSRVDAGRIIDLVGEFGYSANLL